MSGATAVSVERLVQQMRPSKKAGASGVYLMIVCAAYRTACDEDNVPARFDQFLSKPDTFSQPPFESIAHNRISYATAD